MGARATFFNPPSPRGLPAFGFQWQSRRLHQSLPRDIFRFRRSRSHGLRFARFQRRAASAKSVLREWRPYLKAFPDQPFHGFESMP